MILHDAGAPNVALAIIARTLVPRDLFEVKQGANLRGDIVRSAAHRVELLGSSLCKTKVSNFHVRVVILRSKEQVLRLQVCGSVNSEDRV